MASLKRTNPATPAQTQVDRRRRQVAARPAGAATDENTQTADAPSRATSGDRAPTAAADAHRTIPAICRPRFSTTPTRRKRKQWKPICGPGEHPVPNVEEEQAQNKNSVEKEKASVMALLRHVHLSYSVASDEKLLETSHCLGTGGPAASRHRAWSDRTGEEVWNVTRTT